MCLYPKLIPNKKYTATKKNGGNIPSVLDKRVLYIPVACTKCMECKKAKAREWQVRLGEEIRADNKCEFVTLTFSNEEYKKLNNRINDEIKGYDRDNEIATLATRLFLERWRAKHKKSVKHWLVTELGHNGTENIHIHGLIWSQDKKEIEKTWGYGYVFTGEWVNEQTVNYIIKYIMKTDKDHENFKSKILTSKGIGSSYFKRLDSKINKYNKEETKEYYTTKKGLKLALPIYYRNKIYSEKEREKLWLKKLDENIRYVDKTKINIEKNPEEYYNALKEARLKNKRLGYGDDSKNWEREKYEEMQREIMQLKRMHN